MMLSWHLQFSTVVNKEKQANTVLIKMHKIVLTTCLPVTLQILSLNCYTRSA